MENRMNTKTIIVINFFFFLLNNCSSSSGNQINKRNQQISQFNFETVQKTMKSAKERKIIAQDINGKVVEISEAQKKIKEDLKKDKKIHIEIHASFILNKDLNYIGSDSDIYYASSCSITNGKEMNIAGDLINQSGAVKNNLYDVGQIFSRDISSDVTDLTCKLSMFVDHGFSSGGSERAQKLIGQLESFVKNNTAPSGMEAVFSFCSKYLPVISELINIFDALTQDKELPTYRVSLANSLSFVPTRESITWIQTAPMKVAFIITIGKYRFASSDTIDEILNITN